MNRKEHKEKEVGYGTSQLIAGIGVWVGVGIHTGSGWLGFAAACACLLLAPSITRWNISVEDDSA